MPTLAFSDSWTSFGRSDTQLSDNCQIGRPGTRWVHNLRWPIWISLKVSHTTGTMFCEFGPNRTVGLAKIALSLKTQTLDPGFAISEYPGLRFEILRIQRDPEIT